MERGCPSPSSHGSSACEQSPNTDNAPLSGGSSRISTPNTSDYSTSNLSEAVTGTKSMEGLTNYIPLGCVRLSQSSENTSSGDKRGNSKWREIHHVASLLENNAAVVPFWYLPLVQLSEAKWIRSFAKDCEGDQHIMLRIYLLPEDVGRRSVDRHSKGLRSALQQILMAIDTSPKTWNGEYVLGSERAFDPWASAENSSLFYIFNTIPSPAPCPEKILDRYSRFAVRNLLDHSAPLRGLRTSLYPYQARSAAMMVQREASQELCLDPRTENRYAPDGTVFYYGARDTTFLKNARYYDSNRGGILAETMGLGKTLICLAVMLATKHHLPKIPPTYVELHPIRESVGSLEDMVVSVLHRHSIPARSFFARVQADKGDELIQCIRAVSADSPTYSVPVLPARFNRKTSVPPPRRLTLSSSTIVVVPRNLVDQWKREIKKHVHDGSEGLRVLIMNNNKQTLPLAPELLTYDVVLFSRSRFEHEIRDGSDVAGRRRVEGPARCHCPYIGTTRKRDCQCLREDEIYESPLKQIHWLRIIIDEGHEFSSTNSNAVLVADKLVQAERRWVVSGTPARDRLFGIEVDLATTDDIDLAAGPVEEDVLEVPSNDPANEGASDQGSSSFSSRNARNLALEHRKSFNAREEASGAARSLGLLASHFLKVQPWAASPAEQNAEWDDYIYRHEDYRRRTLSGFSLCLRRTLEGLMVKTQADDVEKYIVLPPLEHRIVYLEPSFYDKVTANLFILFLTANAVTSEREDGDYLFHKDSQRARGQLIMNLRQSNFFWTGVTENDVLAVIGHGRRYLAKQNTKCTVEDRALLLRCLEFAQFVLTLPGWRALSSTHEIGLYVEHWPHEAANTWAMANVEDPLLVGVTQLKQAQSYVNDRLSNADPTEGLEAAGGSAKASAGPSGEHQKAGNIPKYKVPAMVKMGVPASGISTQQSTAKRHYVSGTSKVSPKRSRVLSKKITKEEPGVGQRAEHSESLRKRCRSADACELPLDSTLRNTRVVGTTSAKLSYLLEKVALFQTDEKILIFYDGDNTAYYIAQCLELLHVKHLIYAKSLPNDIRSRYIVAFDEDDSIRILLMDVRCGAYGLNVNKASRVFFVNPCCRPSTEAQAIKRAHRIGQDKPVFVETLILKGTIEEAIFERSNAMTQTEHKEARVLEDDRKVSNIIQSAKPLHIDPSDATTDLQMAKLNTPEQLFGRPGRGDARIAGIDIETGDKDEVKTPKPLKRRRTTKRRDTVFETPRTEFGSGLMTSPVVPLQPQSLFGGS